MADAFLMRIVRKTRGLAEELWLEEIFSSVLDVVGTFIGGEHIY